MARDTSDYSEILDRSWDEIPEPQILPKGSYRLKGRNITFMPAKEGISARALMVYSPQEPMEDVNSTEFDALGDNYDIRENEVFYQQWLEKSKDWDALRSHLKLHGINPDGASIQETFKAFKGSEVVGYLDVRTYTSKKTNTPVTENQPTLFAAVA